MRLLSQLIFAMLLTWHTSTVWSLELGGASIIIEEKGEEAAQAALVSGLKTVLVRLTGKSHPEVFPHVEGMLRQPDRWLEHMGYRETPAGLALEAYFDVALLLDSLVAAGVPVLGLVRPKILVWLVTPQDTLLQQMDREGLDADSLDQSPLDESTAEVYSALFQASTSRGVSIVLPSAQEKSGTSLLAADVRGQFDDQVRRASAAYAAPLIATLVPGGRWRAPHWRLLDHEQVLASGELSQAGELPDVVAEFVHNLAEYLGDNYTVTARGESSLLQLRVLDLDSLRAFVHTREQLRRIAGVRGMTVRELDQTTAIFGVDFVDTSARLTSLLKLDPFLGSCTPSLTGAQHAVDDIVLCWQGFR